MEGSMMGDRSHPTWQVIAPEPDMDSADQWVR
jgi:hypothetical protein